MILVGIGVAKDKARRFIVNAGGAVLAEVSMIPNSMEGFTSLLNKIRACTWPKAHKELCL